MSVKKFYTLVSHVPSDEGYLILLDNRPVNTPLKRKILAPNTALAEALVQEWAGQEGTINPDTMPLTQILNTKIDRVADGRAAMTDLIIKYLDTDLLCYRTDHPPELAMAQAGAWDCWLDWFTQFFSVPPLETTTLLNALSQSAATREKTLAYVQDLDADRFTVLQLVTALCGSLVLGLAFLNQAADATQVFDAAHVEEQFKARIYDEDRYGPDPAQAQKDQAVIRDLQAAETFLNLL